MSSLTKLEIFFAILMTLIGVGILTLIIILYANRPEELKENKVNDVGILSFSSLNFIEIDSLPAYSESSYNLGLTGRLILDCYSGMCTVYDDTASSRDVFDYSCSQQCSHNTNQECDCYIEGYHSKGRCSRLYDDSYDNGKYCYADNVIYNWKKKKYVAMKKYALTYYNDAKLKEEECPIGTKFCGIIDDNENKLCLSSGSTCPINYLSENKLNSNKIHSTVDIGNKTFYYTYDEDITMKRKIIAGLVADTDLYLNKDNDEKLLIDTDTISGFLEDNKNLYKEVNLGYDPYEEENIDNKGKSYLRKFYNNKVDLKELRDNINSYNLNHKINEEGIKPVRKNTKFIMIFGLISYISYLFLMLCIIICIRDAAPCGSFFMILFVVFYIVSFVYICINISKFNKLKDLDENAYNFPRIINLIIFSLYLFLIAFIIFIIIYYSKLHNICRKYNCNICNKKEEDTSTTIGVQKTTEKIMGKNENQNDKNAHGGLSSLNITGVN